MYQTLLGLKYLYRDHPTTTICLANRKASHKKILPQYIYIPFPKEMQFNEQTLCWRGWQMFWGKHQSQIADEWNRERSTCSGLILVSQFLTETTK